MYCINSAVDYTLVKEWPLTQEQNDLIDFGIKKSYAILSGQAGVGKTLAVLTLATHIMLKNRDVFTVVICPPKALIAFERELSEKLKVSYSIISSNKTNIVKGARFLVISNTCMEKAMLKIAELLGRYKLLGIIDESHLSLQSPDTKLYKQFKTIRKYFSLLYFTTATSCKNNILGMYHMISLLNHNIFGSLGYFKSRYLIVNRRKITQTTKTGNKVTRTIEEIVGYKNIEELQRILNSFIIVRQREYNLEFNYHKTYPNEFETKSYLAASGGNLSAKAKDFWSVRLRDITFVVDNIHEAYEHEKLSNKEKLFLEVLKKNMDLGRPTIIYCEYIDVLSRLEELMKVFKRQLGITDVLKIQGGVSLSERKKIEKTISIDRPCIITSAGSESINLQRANSIIFYDLPYDIARIIQVIGRITRTDTKYDKQYIEIVELFGTTDTYKRLCMEKNIKLVESLFGKMNTLPYATYNNEQKFMNTLRRALLWAFRRGKLITEEELNHIFERFGE